MQIDRFKLLHGPYTPPVVRPGDQLFCEIRGTVKTGGYTDAPIPWPRLLKTGRHAPIVTAELARAVRLESSIAVAHHWGVCETTVWAWRKALGVERMNEGTVRLYRDYQPQKLPDEVAAEGRLHADTPENRKRQSEARTGNPAHPATANALRHAAGQRKKKSHREAIGKSQELFWLKQVQPIPSELVRAAVEYRKLAPVPSRGVRWHASEEALLGLAPDRVISGILGRSRASVTIHRRALGIVAFRCLRSVKKSQ